MLIWTAFQWGLGVSCGAAIGLFLFLAAVRLLDVATGKSDKAERLSKDSLAALLTRNELTARTNVHLAHLSAVAESMSDHQTIGP